MYIAAWRGRVCVYFIGLSYTLNNRNSLHEVMIDLGATSVGMR